MADILGGEVTHVPERDLLTLGIVLPKGEQQELWQRKGCILTSARRSTSRHSVAAARLDRCNRY